MVRSKTETERMLGLIEEDRRKDGIKDAGKKMAGVRGELCTGSKRKPGKLLLMVRSREQRSEVHVRVD